MATVVIVVLPVPGALELFIVEGVAKGVAVPVRSLLLTWVPEGTQRSSQHAGAPDQTSERPGCHVVNCIPSPKAIIL